MLGFRTLESPCNGCGNRESLQFKLIDLCVRTLRSAGDGLAQMHREFIDTAGLEWKSSQLFLPRLS